MTTNPAVLCEKGYYNSIKSSLTESFGNIYGNFIISLDYIFTKKLKKYICTYRIVVRKQQLTTILERLHTEYGNYHLNYIILMNRSLLDSDEVDFIITEINKYLLATFSVYENNYIYNRNMIDSEILMYKTLFKCQKLKHISFKWLFVNQNINNTFMKYKL